MKNKLLIYGLLLLLIVSCGKSLLVSDINFNTWNDQTIETLIEKCHINENDYNKIKELPFGCMMIGGHKFYTIEEQVRFSLNYRTVLLNYLIKQKINIKGSDFFVFEIYKSDQVLYIFSEDKKSFDQIDINLENYEVKVKNNLGRDDIPSYAKVFDIKDKGEYVNSIEVPLEYAQFYTEININGNEMSYSLKDVWLW